MHSVSGNEVGAKRKLQRTIYFGQNCAVGLRFRSRSCFTAQRQEPVRAGLSLPAAGFDPLPLGEYSACYNPGPDSSSLLIKTREVVL